MSLTSIEHCSNRFYFYILEMAHQVKSINHEFDEIGEIDIKEEPASDEDDDFPLSPNFSDDDSSNHDASSSVGNNNKVEGLAKTKRDGFLTGLIKAEQLINATPKNYDSLPEPIKNIRREIELQHKAISEPSSAFYATIPNVPLISSGIQERRSSLVTNNHNALFVSQATNENVRDALQAQRYRNVPRSLQAIAPRLGTDIDALSQSISVTPNGSHLSIMSYNDGNHRTIGSQTTVETVPVPRFNVEHKATQTTKNSGVFTITIDDVNKLSKEHRNALIEFKRVSCFIFK